MSLLYVIDGCNIIHHQAFPATKYADTRVGLLTLLASGGLTGSKTNTSVVVFDGYWDRGLSEYVSGSSDTIRIIFSEDKTADEIIADFVNANQNNKNLIVVSDDKEIITHARLMRKKTMNVSDFLLPLNPKRNSLDDDRKPGFEVSEKINQELRKIWLKEK